MENQRTEKKNAYKTGGKKGCLTVVIVFVFFSIFLGLLGSKGLLKTEETNKLSRNEKQIKESCNVTDKEAIKISQILENCEIITIDKIEHDEILDDMFNEGDTGYRLQSNRIKNIIMYLNSKKEVIVVRHADIDMFSENTYKTKFSSFYLTVSQETKLQISVQNGVKSILKSPSSAEFPLIAKWNFHRDALTNIVTIRSYVDSQNSFGATIRSEFVVLYKITGDIEQGEYTLLYFEFDNQIIADNR